MALFVAAAAFMLGVMGIVWPVPEFLFQGLGMGLAFVVLLITLFQINQTDLRRERLWLMAFKVAVIIRLIAMTDFPAFSFWHSIFYLSFLAILGAGLVFRPYQPHRQDNLLWIEWFGGVTLIVFVLGTWAMLFFLPVMFQPATVNFPVLALLPWFDLVIALFLLWPKSMTRRWKTTGLVLGGAMVLSFLANLIYLLDFYSDLSLHSLGVGMEYLSIAILGIAFHLHVNSQIPEGPRPHRNRRANRKAHQDPTVIYVLLLTLVYMGMNLIFPDDPVLFVQRSGAFLVLILLSSVLWILRWLYARKHGLILYSRREARELERTRNHFENKLIEGNSILSETRNTLQDQMNRHMALERILRLSKERFETLVETMNEGMRVVNQEREITYVNQALCRIMGYQAAELIGRRLDDFCDEENQIILADELTKRHEGIETPYKITWLHKNGNKVPTVVSPRIIWDDQGNFKGTFSVVSEQATRPEQRRRRDSLTGLPNYDSLLETLDKTIKKADLEKKRLALLLLDLDRFKRIDDSLGHQAGDILLKAIAERLGENLEDGDFLARLGGDSFAIMLSEFKENMEVINKVVQIQTIFGQTFRAGDIDVMVSTSIGISMFPGDGASGAALLKSADAAMHHVKMQGRNNYAFYTEDMNQEALARLEMENSLRDALKNDELCLFFQPKQLIAEGSIGGVEVLVRWIHPELGRIDPDSFIPIAEETGLIHPLSEWVLSRACQYAREWIDSGRKPIQFAINLSALQFSSETLPAQIVSALSRAELDPEMLVLEITESLAMENAERTIGLLAHLKTIGLKVSIDDFGTGYSSLTYLRRFPIDELKIDRAFITNLEQNQTDQAIVRSIIELGHSMNLTVIAEGIETSEQMAILVEMGCDLAQGFYISKPVDFETLCILSEPGGYLDRRSETSS